MNTQDKGFSLIELLVVIAILALLAGLLFPVFASARRRGNLAVCTSNLRQIGAAIGLYAADYDDAVPRAPSANAKMIVGLGRTIDPELDPLIAALPDVADTLYPYTKAERTALFRCPLDLVEDFLRVQPEFKDTWFETNGSSYEYCTKDALTGKKLGDYKTPSQTRLAFDLAAMTQGTPAQRNSLFADLHVKLTKPSDLPMYREE